MTRYLPALAVCLALTGCATPTTRIVTKTVDVAVPVRCAPTIAPPPAHIMTMAELQRAINTASTVTEQARIVSEQLLLWLGYGPELEAAVQECAGTSK
ncbi:MAG: hypothetical protein ACP5QR_04965 [Rhizomicrobium sp.]